MATMRALFFFYHGTGKFSLCLPRHPFECLVVFLGITTSTIRSFPFVLGYLQVNSTSPSGRPLTSDEASQPVDQRENFTIRLTLKQPQCCSLNKISISKTYTVSITQGNRLSGLISRLQRGSIKLVDCVFLFVHNFTLFSCNFRETSRKASAC